MVICYWFIDIWLAHTHIYIYKITMASITPSIAGTCGGPVPTRAGFVCLVGLQLLVDHT